MYSAFADNPPASVHLRTDSTQVAASISGATSPQRLRASALVVTLTVSLVLMTIPGAPLWFTLSAAAGFLASAAGLAGRSGVGVTVRVTPHLVQIDGVGTLPLAAVRKVCLEGDGRVWVRTASAGLALPRNVVSEDARWLCAWLDGAAQAARARLVVGEDPDDCTPPHALEGLRGVCG